jgi:hypothetical protein
MLTTLLPIREGRHRYFRLASPKVVEMLDGIMALALENRPRYRPLSRQARELSAARICYDHLAGRLSVDLTTSLITHEYIAVGDLREALEEQRKLRGAPLYPYLFYARNPAYFRGWASLISVVAGP